MKFKTSQK